MILEELAKSDSIFLNLNLDLEKKVIDVVGTLEVLSLAKVCLLSTTSLSSKSTLSSIRISSIDEFQVLDFIGLIAKCLH